MDRCKHDFLIDQCADCRPAPPGIPPRVFITSAGQVFHGTSTCRGLLEGQAKARYYGHNPRDARQVPLSEARAHGLAACTVCLPEA